MGEGTTRIESANGSSARVRELGSETEAMRRQLDELVMELDRRRHQAFDWRLQLRRHGRALAMIGGGARGVGRHRLSPPPWRGAGVSGARSRPLTELADRGERLRRVLGRILDDPDRLAAAEAPRTPGSRRQIDGPPRSRWKRRGRVLPYVAGSLPRGRRPATPALRLTVSRERLLVCLILRQRR